MTEHQRRHGPAGYQTYITYKDWLRDEFAFRCVYCLNRERWYPNGSGSFGVEHAISQREAPDLALSFDNLLYACNRCNSFKTDLEGILNPCIEPMAANLGILTDGRIDPLTILGRILVDTLQLNDPDVVEMRSRFILFAQHLNEGTVAPQVIAETIKILFSYPEDLPDLRNNRPPRNSRPEGVNATYFLKRQNGTLPSTY